MKLLRMISLSVVAWLVLSAVPAFAACANGCEGGMEALSYDKYLWPGQTVTWNAKTYTDKGAAGPEDGPFFAYLVDPVRRSVRVPDVEDGVPLGQLAIGTTRDPSLLDVSLTFTVPPGTPPGNHSVEVCDDPCSTRLAYIGPTWVEVVSGDIEARLSKRIDRLEEQMIALRWSSERRARRVVKRSSEVLRTELAVAEDRLETYVAELDLKVTGLEKRLASQEEPAERGEVSQSALAGGIIVLVLGAWFVRERRHNSL